jgi:hypothetical protein
MTRRSVPYIITASNVLSAFATGAVHETDEPRRRRSARD